MGRFKLPIILTSIIVVFSLTMPVSALFFEYYYFETDKLVYEVGETINMVAKVTADFSEDGWCYASFEIVTDLGPKFANGSSIPPSPTPRYLTSSYTVSPEDTNPGITGVQTFVIFNIEVFDTYSQKRGETIEVQLIRGRLHVTSAQQLSVEYGTNEKLTFQITSIHTEDITYPNKTISLAVQDSKMNTIFSNDTTTDSTGSFNLNWTPSLGKPDIYNLTVSTLGDNDFQPLNQSFLVTVQPSVSNLTVITAPESIYCETPNGNHNEIAYFMVKHTTMDNNSIDNSTISYQASFLNTNFTNIGNGFYEIYIPFTRASGIEFINITSHNSLYQSATNSVEILVLQREISYDISTNPNLICNTTLNINITTTDQIIGSTIDSLPFTIHISINGTIIDTISGLTDFEGRFSYNLLLPHSMWGLGEILVQSNDTLYYKSGTTNQSIEVLYEPWIEYEVVQEIVLGQNASISLQVYNPMNSTLPGVSITLFDSLFSPIGTRITDSSGSSIFNWTVSSGTPTGYQQYTIYLNSSQIDYMSIIQLDIDLFIYLPLLINIEDSIPNITRGDDFIISLSLSSTYQPNSVVQIEIDDELREIWHSYTVITDNYSQLTLSTAHNNTLGTHSFRITSLNTSFFVFGTTNFDVIIIGSMNISFEIGNIIYGNLSEINYSGFGDNEESLDLLTLNLYLTESKTLITKLENITSATIHSFTLPVWILPGQYEIILNFTHSLFMTYTKTVPITVWMRTSITITITVNDSELGGETCISPLIAANYFVESISTISSGSIISPPPILLNDVTVVPESTTLDTSLDNCPRFNSGTNNRSTDLANFLTSSSGKGQIVLRRNALIDLSDSEFIITSSTVLDVHPNEITPQSAWLGPVVTTSVKRVKLSVIFADILRIKSLWT